MPDKKSTWVVFKRTIPNQGSFPAVCQQPEWEALERLHPGYHQLVHAGIPSEVEAEKLARVCQTPAAVPLARARPWQA
jgi:hypothetical protein